MSAQADWNARRGEPPRDVRRDPYASGYGAAPVRDALYREDPPAAAHRAPHDWPERRAEGGEPPRGDRGGYYPDLAGYRAGGGAPAAVGGGDRDYAQWDERGYADRRPAAGVRDVPAERGYSSPARRPGDVPVDYARDPRDQRDARDPRERERELAARGRDPRQYAAAPVPKEPTRRSPSADVQPDLAYESERERLYREYETQQRLPVPPGRGADRVPLDKVPHEAPHHDRDPRDWDRERDRERERYAEYHRAAAPPQHRDYPPEWRQAPGRGAQDEAMWIRPPHERSRSPPSAPAGGRVSPKKAPGPSTAAPCTRKGHEQYLCDIYCSVENRLVCLLCLRRDEVHRQHKCRAITAAPSNMRQSVVEWMSNASKQKSDLQTVQTHIEKYIEKLQKNEEQEVARLEEAVADLKRRLEKTTRQLVDQARKDTQDEVDRLQNIKKDISSYMSKIDETMGEVQKLNSASSIAELVHLKKFIALTAFQKDEQVLPISKVGFKAHTAVHVDKLFDVGYHNDELLLPASVNPSNAQIDKEVVPTGIDYSVYMD